MFFGREAEIAEAAQRLGDTSNGHRRWLQIEGPSGAGKSSLARAGVVPAVRKGWVAGAPTGWRVAVFRPGPDPLRSLAQAVHASLEEELGPEVTLDAVGRAFEQSETALGSFVRQHVPEGVGYLLVIDQLEEAFTLAGSDHEALKRFDALLAGAVRDKGGPLYLVTTIRSDFVARFGDLPEMERLLNAEAERYYLKPMSAPGLRAAIEEPAKPAGLVWEDGLVERMLEDAAASEGGLPLIAHVLQALWAARKGRVLGRGAYDALGGVGGALAKSADAIVDALGNEGRERARRLLLRLVKIGRGAEDTRQTAARGDALEAGGGGGEAEPPLAPSSISPWNCARP